MRLLGRDFDRLAPVVRAVHCGRSLTLQGSADVTRGRGVIAQLLCKCGRLARTQVRAHTRVEISVRGEREVWRRHFGKSPVMQSVLSSRDGALCERFGPLALHFELAADNGAVVWRPLRASLFAIPIPRRWLAAIRAQTGEHEGRYWFEVLVAFPGVGKVIEYRGHLAAFR